MKCQPNFGVFNDDFSKFIVTSDEDILYVDKIQKREIDLDEDLGITSIKNIRADKSHFYILANKRENDSE